MNPRILSFFLLNTLVFSGCIDNYYEEYYIENTSSKETRADTSQNEIALRFSNSPDQQFPDEIFTLIEDGYELIGESSFCAVHCPWTCAIDQAKDIGASLIIFRENFHRSKVVKGITYIPTTTYSYSSGYSSSGNYVNVRTQSTSLNAVPYTYEVDYYNQYAFFFRKRLLDENFYGVILKFPQFLPGDNESDPIEAQVAAVVKGTKAWNDGLRRGDIVDKINGHVIKTKKDIKPFSSGKEPITNISVK